MKAVAIALLIASLLATARSAVAHTRSESTSAWGFNGAVADLVVTVPDPDIQRLSAGEGRPSDQMVEEYLLSRVFPVAHGMQCPLVSPIAAISSTSGFRKFHMVFACATETDIQIHSDAFFDLVPGHVHFAQIQDSKGDYAELLLTTDRRTAAVSVGLDSPLETAPFAAFVRMGVMHIFTGVDHICFLLGLVLISRRARDLVFVVTGFTLGHSLTLGLAVTGVLRPHAEYIDALVALTIALIGADNAAVASPRPMAVAAIPFALLIATGIARLAGVGALPPLLLLGAALFSGSYLLLSSRLRDAGRVRMIITVVFGLIHGFGFASNLTEMRLPTGHLIKLLAGFNLGVELGQFALILCTLLFVAALSRMKWTLPRPFVVDTGSAFLVGMGFFWFVVRSF